MPKIARLAFPFVLLAAACAPSMAPRGIENDNPSLTSDAFLSRDGLRLPLRRWEASNPQAIIVALHGMSDYSNAFDLPARYWAQHGITTLAYDQRGFGQAPHPGLWPGSDALRSDLADVVDVVRREHPEVPIYALGESMGGAVVLSALASARPPHVDGIILVSPAVWSRKDMPLSYRAALWIAAHTFPGMKVSGRGLKIWPSDNIPMLRKLARDPLFQHSTRADAVYGLVNLMDEGRRSAAELPQAMPILWLYGRNDQVIPPASTTATIKILDVPADIRCYPHGYHMLLRDLEGPAVWKDVLGWVQSQKTRSVSSKIATQLNVDEERGRDDGPAAGREGQAAELGSGRSDRCLDAADERKIVGK